MSTTLAPEHVVATPTTEPLYRVSHEHALRRVPDDLGSCLEKERMPTATRLLDVAAPPANRHDAMAPDAAHPINRLPTHARLRARRGQQHRMGATVTNELVKAGALPHQSELVAVSRACEDVANVGRRAVAKDPSTAQARRMRTM